MENRNLGTGTRGAYPTDKYHSYWRENYRDRPYYQSQDTWDDYDPAYRLGYDSYSRHGTRGWDAAERDLEADWNRTKGTSRLTWERAKQAVRDGWHHLERMMPGDADRDRR